MHGYAKIKLVNRSKSIDFSHPCTQTQQINNENMSQNYMPHEIENPKEIFKNNNMKNDHLSSELEYEDEVKLSRNGSVSSTAPQRFKLDRQSCSKKEAIQSAMKRAFSISRSSSVSESYCRIHDQGSVSPLNYEEDVEYMEGGDEKKIRSIKKNKKKYRSGRILKACKRLFGL